MAAKAAFLKSFRTVGIISPAAAAAGVARQTVYVWQEQDDDFVAAFNGAREEAIDALELEARRRAVEGAPDSTDLLRSASDTLLCDPHRMSQDPLRSATSGAVTRLSQLLLSRKLKDVRDVDGTSVEDQERAELRIPHLLKVPAVVHFLSCEPLLGPLNLVAWLNNVQWVISGGESGPKHRPVDVDWIRELNAECAAAGVAHFFKQHGGRTHAQGGCLLDGVEIKHFPTTHAALAA